MNELEKQTPAEETATPAEAVNAAENNPETCTVDKECVETESPSEELAAAADSIEQKADLRRYHSMTRSQLVQAMRDILEANEMNAHKDVAAIKQSFFVLKEKEEK